MTENKRNILKHIIVYLPSRYFSQFLGFFTSVFMKRFLGPFYIGVWSLLRFIIIYVNYSELGSSMAIYYKIPFYNGKGDRKEAEKVKSYSKSLQSRI